MSNVVMVEIRDNAAYIYSDKIAGVGGMPIGTNGKAVLLSGGSTALLQDIWCKKG